MPEMRSVYSSHINRVGYDEDKREVTVEFSNGSVVVYSDVPPDKGMGILSAPSIGQEIWRSLRGQHDHTYRQRKGGRG